MPRHSVVPAVLFVLEENGRYLFQLRKNTGFADGFWSIPGGHFEPEEHALTVVAREAKEELGITIEEEGIEFLGMHHMRRKDGNDGLNLYFKITAWQGTPTNAEPETCESLAWFSPEEFPENIFPEIHEILGPKPPHKFIEGHHQPRLGQHQ